MKTTKEIVYQMIINTGIKNLKPLENGASSNSYIIIHNDKEYVLKLFDAHKKHKVNSIIDILSDLKDLPIGKLRVKTRSGDS